MCMRVPVMKNSRSSVQMYVKKSNISAFHFIFVRTNAAHHVRTQEQSRTQGQSKKRNQHYISKDGQTHFYLGFHRQA